MAAVKVPAFPKGVARGVWANKLAGSALYAVESNSINYDTGTAVNIFSIPQGIVLWAVGLEVTTAFDSVQDFVVQDTVENLAVFSGNAITDTGFSEMLVLKRYAKGGGPGHAPRSIQVDANTDDGSAGVAKVWLVFKPDQSALSVDNA